MLKAHISKCKFLKYAHKELNFSKIHKTEMHTINIHIRWLLFSSTECFCVLDTVYLQIVNRSVESKFFFVMTCVGHTAVNVARLGGSNILAFSEFKKTWSTLRI